MTTTRRPDESFSDYRARQKTESAKAKVALRAVSGNLPPYQRLETNQIVTQDGITKGRMRATKYAVDREVKSKLSNTQKRKLGIKI